MRTGLAITLATLFLAVGCGGGGGGGGTGGSGSGESGTSGSAGTGGESGTGGGTGGVVAPPASVDGTHVLSAATDAEMKATCDWFATVLGGYGAATPCTGGGGLHAPVSQDDCLAVFPQCDATFADFDSCVAAIAQAQQACTASSVMDARASSDCAGAIAASCL